MISTESTSLYLSFELQVIWNIEKIIFTNVYGPQLLDDKKKMIAVVKNLKE
jgi:hypothetical protein